MNLLIWNTVWRYSLHCTFTWDPNSKGRLLLSQHLHWPTLADFIHYLLAPNIFDKINENAVNASWGTSL